MSLSPPSMANFVECVDSYFRRFWREFNKFFTSWSSFGYCLTATEKSYHTTPLLILRRKQWATAIENPTYSLVHCWPQLLADKHSNFALAHLLFLNSFWRWIKRVMWTVRITFYNVFLFLTSSSPSMIPTPVLHSSPTMILTPTIIYIIYCVQ